MLKAKTSAAVLTNPFHACILENGTFYFGEAQTMTEGFEKPSVQEILDRIDRLYRELNKQGKQWDAALLFDRTNHFYLTGTMQDGVFVLKNDGSYAYFVKRSYERAKTEALISNVYPMSSYRDLQSFIGGGNIFIETEIVTFAMLERLKKYISVNAVYAADRAVMSVRSVKSPYELERIREAGKLHARLLDEVVPTLLTDGMSEADFYAELYAEMVKLGHHGISRFAMFQTEVVVGQIGFGENSLYPTCFNGPGGMKGAHPAAPAIGDRRRTLTKGDLVFVDIGFGLNGYHTDRTQVYSFGANPSDEVERAHRACMRVQRETADMLKTGAVPSQIYETVMGSLDKAFLENFMGFGDRRVSFLGHGLGLQIDEYPVIAKGFNEPLPENTVIALEPKKGIAGVGMVGVEDTYIVTASGGVCVTDGEKDIMRVK